MIRRNHIILFVVIIAFFSLGFQYMYAALTETAWNNIATRFGINLIPLCIIGLIDFWIVRSTYRFRRNDNTLFVVTLNLLLSALSAILLAIVIDMALSFILSEEYQYDFGTSSLPIAMFNCIVVLLIEIFFYHNRQIEAEKKLVIIEKEKLQYQYETLKAQVNPHFLFNSLNVLSSLAYEDADKTNLFAKKLSNIYRYVLLSNSRSTVPVSEELTFLESYIFLEKIRFGDALHFEITNTSNSDKQIIPVSLQLLAENATKHNIATSAQPLTIRIHITNDGITVSNNLQLRSSVEKNGYGLSNLQKQYDLYDKKIEVTQTNTDFTVKIPFVG